MFAIITEKSSIIVQINHIASIVFSRNKCFFFVLFLWFLSKLLISFRLSWDLLERSVSPSSELSSALKIFLGLIFMFFSSARVKTSWKLLKLMAGKDLNLYLQVLSSLVHFNACIFPVSSQLLLFASFCETKMFLLFPYWWSFFIGFEER